MKYQIASVYKREWLINTELSLILWQYLQFIKACRDELCILGKMIFLPNIFTVYFYGHASLLRTLYAYAKVQRNLLIANYQYMPKTLKGTILN